MDNKKLKRKTGIVIVITLLMMVTEIYFGIITNSMALTADGFHMGAHLIAFIITLITCLFAVKYEDKTNKINALGGYTGAILLGFTSLGIIWESIERIFNPLAITFSEALLVAIIGLIVNLLCAIVMWDDEQNLHAHHNGHKDESHEHKHENLNFKAAYMHILADILTSVLAIIALLCGKYLGLPILDSIIGFLGGLVIAKWSIDLLKSSSKILLDFE